MLIGLIICGLNYLITYVSKFVTESIEKNATKTDFNISLATKSSIALFINSGFQTVLIQILLPWYQQNLQAAQLTIFAASGLIVNQHKVLLLNAIINPFFTILDISHWMKKANIYWFITRKAENGGPIYKTQRQLNE